MSWESHGRCPDGLEYRGSYGRHREFRERDEHTRFTQVRPLSLGGKDLLLLDWINLTKGYKGARRVNRRLALG